MKGFDVFASFFDQVGPKKELDPLRNEVIVPPMGGSEVGSCLIDKLES